MESDSQVFYTWRVDLEFVGSWITGGRRIPTYQDYIPELQRFLSDGMTLLVADAATGAASGFVRTYNMNPVDGWAWVQAYLVPDARKRPYWAGEAGMLFADYLFRMFPLRKLYAEVFEYNRGSMHLCERLGFEPCGRLPKHVWFDGALWDSVIWELPRESWVDIRKRFRFLLGVERQVEDAIVEDVIKGREESYA